MELGALSPVYPYIIHTEWGQVEVRDQEIRNLDVIMVELKVVATVLSD